MNSRNWALVHTARAAQQSAKLIQISHPVASVRRFLRRSLFTGITAFALVSIVSISPSLKAQSATTSGISGVITGESGAAIPDATVELLHEPTGTVYSSRLQPSGRYNFQNLRAGGPYTLTVKANGYQSTQQRNLFVALANESNVNLTVAMLSSDVVQLEAFVVDSGRAITVFDSGSAGTGSILDNQRVQDTATVGRSITDFARLNPLVTLNDLERGEITAAGQNNRYNSIQVDGINLNDQFGLEANGFSAIRNPISIDTIQEFTIDIAPYDVRRSGFTGAAINAVTKSGTNEFKGTAYYYFTDQNLRSENVNTGVKEPFEETTYGITYGGPIIQDKLFFFVNYEKFDRTAEADDPGFTPNSADVARIVARSAALGFDAGVFETISAAQEEEKMLAKLDWNINSNHRLSVRYDTNEGQQPQFGEYNDFSSSSPETALSSHFYTDSREVKTIVAELNSFWTDNLQSQLRWGNTAIDKVPTLQPDLFPEIEVRGVSGTTQSGGATTRGEVFFGTEDSRQSNLLTSDVTNLALNFDYFSGDVTYSFGVDSEESKFDNLFLQDTFGNYVYSSITNYENNTGASGNRQFGIEGQSVAAQSDFTITGFYGQAKWAMSPSVTLQAGLRADVVDTSKSPPFAQHFFDAFGVRNDATIGGETVVAPRVSFVYKPVNDDTLQIRGGLGLFQGRAPAVFLSNSFSNNGVTTAFRSISGTTFNLQDAINGTLTGNAAIFNFDPSNPRPDLPPGTPGNRIDFIEDGLQLPAVWRANIAVDKKLPIMGLVAGVEFLLTQAEAEVYVDDINLKPAGTAPDGRTIYSGRANTAFSNIYRLSNADGGHATNMVLSLTKPSNGTWYSSASYTWGDSVDTSSVTSATAFSNFANRAVFNGGGDETGTSNYEIKHRIMFNVGYTFKWTNAIKTRVSLLYDGRSGRPYSAISTNDINGDGINFNDLIYIPTGTSDPLVSFASAADQASFFAYTAQNGLDAYAGTFAPRNSIRSNFVHRWDVKIVQEIPFSERFKTELYLDILNVGNLINNSWGLVDQVPFSYVEDAVTATIANGKYVYSYANPSGPTTQANQSRWAVQFGLKLFF